MMELHSNELDKYIREHPYQGPFVPRAWHNKTGDQIDVYFTDDLAYAENLTDSLVLLRCMKTHAIVGCKILNAKTLMEGK